MTDFEGHLKHMLDLTAGDPPRAIGAEAVRRRARRQEQRIRLTTTGLSALVLGAVLGAALTFATSGHSVTVTSGSGASVAASPSDDLADGQTVEVTLKGFPANQRVSLAECPNPILLPEAPCSSAPVQGVLNTDAKGASSGTIVVKLSPAGFGDVFGGSICPPGCLLVATSRITPSSAAVTATTTLTFTSLSSGEVVEPPGFGVAAASFINGNQGWALGTTGCPACVGIAATTNGGSAWSYLPTPPTTYWGSSHEASGVSNIAFANASDGYMFAPGLWATTDGGRTWTNEEFTGVASLTIDGSYAYVLTGYDDAGSQQLYRSLLGSDSWQLLTLPVAAGQLQSFELASSGANLVLLETGVESPGMTAAQLGGIWTSSDQGTDWQSRSVPCTVADGGAATLSVAYQHPQSWLVDCFNSEQSSEAQNTLQHLFGTNDGGQSWVRLPDPPQHNAPTLLADNGGGHAFLATQGVSDALDATLDGGRTWTVAIGDGGSFGGWADLEFVSSNAGFVVGPTRLTGEGVSAAGHLYRTLDGGQTWASLSVSP